MPNVDSERFERNEKIVRDAPPVEQDALDMLLQRWGLPPTAPLALLYAPSEAFIQKPVPGFRAETVYTPCDSMRAWACPIKFLGLPTLLPDMVLVKHLRGIPWPDDDPPPPIVEIRFRLWRPGTSTFAEARLDPETWDTHIDVRDLDEHAMSAPKSLRILLDALRTHVMNKPGPKPGLFTYSDRDDFLARCVKAVNSIIKEDRELRVSRITKTRVASAEALAVDPKTLTNHLRYHGLSDDWKVFRGFLLKLEGINRV